MKDIPGFGGKYKISDSGEVVGPSGRILKPRRDKDGYLRLNMMHPKKRARHLPYSSPGNADI
ncbi:hypothetical protein D7V69_05815 [Escherichia coli]|uniref:NUMOD4 domain-containing protein n=1 Tax=Escherichia coli TaxID=562 RepID=UPI000FA880A8|nr:hypothetical protein [Escherichia coli]